MVLIKAPPNPAFMPNHTERNERTVKRDELITSVVRPSPVSWCCQRSIIFTEVEHTTVVLGRE